MVDMINARKRGMMIPPVLVLAMLLSSGIAAAGKFPNPVGHVNDFAGVLSTDTERKLENLLRGLKEKTGAEVYDFYMDMRAFGKAYEEFYERVQEEGITFIRGRGAEVEVLPDGKLRVKGEDANLGRLVAVDVDMVILATAIEPQPDADRVARLFGLGRTPDGWFAEAHPKLRPVETSTAGVFLAGACQGPRDVPDTVAHAGAAALEVVRLFNQGEVTISPIVAVVEAAECVGCGECILACPYSAISRNGDGKAHVNPALCQGCGTCAATCPAGAITALHFTDEEIVAQIDGLLEMVV